MSPQFVDFNADGHLDIVAGTFDGSPHVAYGSEKGFQEPSHILDRNGDRILLDSFWNYESKKWETFGRKAPFTGQCTSAVAFDWDADGDYDLLLGDYKNGTLFRVMNEGKAGEPKFAPDPIAVHAGGAPLGLPGGLSTPRLVDWDGDGRVDVICGSFGEHQGDPTGGVYWYRNVGKKGAPEFESARALVKPIPAKSTGPDQPDLGLYAEAADYDGDGDLDLLVGGYSRWEPPAPELTAAQKAELEALDAEQTSLREAQSKLFEGAMAGVENPTSEQLDALYKKVFESDEFKKVNEQMRDVAQRISKLRPGSQRVANVWLYRRVSASAAR